MSDWNVEFERFIKEAAKSPLFFVTIASFYKKRASYTEKSGMTYDNTPSRKNQMLQINVKL